MQNYKSVHMQNVKEARMGEKGSQTGGKRGQAQNIKIFLQI